MSERIKQLVYVIQYVKKNYKGVNLSKIRKDAAIQVAQKLEITYNTVADKYLRQLKDEFKKDLGTARFERLLEQWLKYNDDALKIILLKHCDDESDKQLVLSLFHDYNEPNSSLTSDSFKEETRNPVAVAVDPQTQLIEKIGSIGLKTFPDDFMSPEAVPGKKFAFPSESIYVSQQPDGTYAVQSYFGYRQLVRLEIEGKFIVYAKLSGKRTVVVPLEIVEVSRTVNNYKRYLRELRQEVVNHFGSISDDRDFAEEKAKEFFRKHRLPWIF
jgi:hypothetical protein